MLVSEPVPCIPCSQTAVLPRAPLVPVAETHTQHCMGVSRPSFACQMLSQTCTDQFLGAVQEGGMEGVASATWQGRQAAVHQRDWAGGRSALAGSSWHPCNMLAMSSQEMLPRTTCTKILGHACCLPLVFELTPFRCMHAECLPFTEVPSCSNCRLCLGAQPLQLAVSCCCCLRQWLRLSITSAVCTAEAAVWQPERPELGSCSDAALEEDISCLAGGHGLVPTCLKRIMSASRTASLQLPIWDLTSPAVPGTERPVC